MEKDELLAQYENGNMVTYLYSDGTKIHYTDDDEFIPVFAEAYDISISQRCDNGCKFCYYGCTPEGVHGKLTDWKFFDSMHPYTEIAINLQFPTPPNLMEFLYIMKAKQVFVNVTINQNHFMSDYGKRFIAFLVKMDLIKGIGISVTNPFEEGFLDEVKKYPNAVLHVIAGIMSPEDMYAMGDDDLKLLILGYKKTGRGNDYYDAHQFLIDGDIRWLKSGLREIIDKYKVVAFDNLALVQLDVKNSGVVTPEEWDIMYAGEDGTLTFYIDLVNGTFARSSVSPKKYTIGDKTIDEMFEIIRQELKDETT